MKSPITLKIKNRAFLIFEIMLAISLLSLFSISIFGLNSFSNNISIWSVKELDILRDSVKIIDNYLNNNIEDIRISKSYYGNDSFSLNIEPFFVVKSDLVNSWGGSTCSPRISFDEKKLVYYDHNINIGNLNKSTGIISKNSIVYLSADSPVLSDPDFFIIDYTDLNNPKIVSSLNTGPGISSLYIAGPYAYVANTSSNSQLQIIDIHNRSSPVLISQIKLPLPESSTTPSKANSIFYRNGFVYLGTNKWDGPEFFIIDVSNPLTPFIVGSFETNTLINDIFVYKDKAYIATSDQNQMRILDISDKSSPKIIQDFTFSGWETQQGKVIDFFENNLLLGRTVGGINRISNHEVFLFSSTSTITLIKSHDIPSGVYGLLLRNPYIFMITHFTSSEFQVWRDDLSEKIFEKPLGAKVVSMSCDNKTLFLATGDEYGLSVLKLE